MLNEPPSNIIVIDEAVIRIIWLNITNLKPDDAVLIIEITNPDGEIVKYRLKSDEKTPLPKYFYTKILKSGIYTIRVINVADTPVVISLNIEEGIVSMRRPYIYYSIVVFVIGTLLGTVSIRMQRSKNMLFTP